METWTGLLAVGLLFVLPQIVGFAASRVWRRRSAAAWPFGASGAIGLLWVIGTAGERHANPEVPTGLITISLVVLHFAVGTVLGVLDQRARAAK